MDRSGVAECSGEVETVAKESEDKEGPEPQKKTQRRGKPSLAHLDPANVLDTSMEPRRKVKSRHISGGPHSLIQLISESQPTPCSISRTALVQMHLHSFLCRCEIIGWLAGLREGEHIIVTNAFSVKAHGGTENPNMNVEMDIQDAFEVQESIKTQGLQIVGWYHSHPKFQNTPSILDIENQIKQQRTAEGKFIGAIVSPFWAHTAALPPLCLFTVEEDADHHHTFGHFPPCAVRFSVFGDVDSQSLLETLRELAITYLSHPHRTQLASKWSKGKTYGEKIRSSTEELVGAPLAQEIYQNIKDLWGLEQEPVRKVRKIDS